MVSRRQRAAAKVLMASSTSKPPASLREQAQARFRRTGNLTEPHVGSTGALRVLLDLASSPDTAPDALALLHELQVHQVELDMQAEELRGTRNDLETAYARQVQLFDAAPVAYCVVDPQTCLRQVNATGALWLGNTREALHGQRLDLFLSPPSRAALRDLLVLAEQQRTTQSCTLVLQLPDTPPRTVCASAGLDPASHDFLLVLNAMPEAQAAPS